ncbi:MAG: uroporphyrinogen-III C-methyltransferase [Myxococcaceae bacterium]
MLVGAGPGAPDLITVRGLRALQSADVVVFDRLLDRGLLELARPGAQLLYAGKEGGGEHTPQPEINAMLIEHARRGAKVVRLKCGDSFVFGRGGEEALALAQAGIRFEVIPGVSAGASVPALANIPVTHRGASTSVTFATGHTAKGEPDWAWLAGAQTLVLFMGAHKLREICSKLVWHGRAASTPAALIEAGSLPHQRITTGTLENLADRFERDGVGSPALLVIGEVVNVREQLDALYAEAQQHQEAIR